MKNHIVYFNPDVVLAKESYQDFLTEIEAFNAGTENINFNDFMFAVNERYQDVFYEFEGEDLPIAAWIMRSIIDYAEELINSVVGFKAIFLHSVPEAEEFYKANGFCPVEINMKPLHSIDSEYTAMYLTLREVYMNYDK